MAGKTPKPKRRKGGTLKQGPPCKLSGELLEALCDGLRKGGFIAHVAAKCGVHEVTVQGWIADGQKPGASFEKAALARAREAGEESRLRRISKAGSLGNAAGVKAQTWILERMNRTRYAARQELTGAEGGALQISGFAELMGLAFNDADPDAEGEEGS
jgi:transposase